MSLRSKFAIILCAALTAGALTCFVWNLNVGLCLAVALLAGAGLALLPAHKREAIDSSSPVRDALRQEREAASALDAHADTLLEAMMNGMREGMLVIDKGMRVIASNRAARDIFSQVEGKLESYRLSELTRNPSIHSAFTSSLNNNEQAGTKV